VTGDFEADGVDEDDATNARRSEQGEFRGNPPADRAADDRDVLHCEVVEQRRVQFGQAGDRAQPVGAWCAAEPGMGGCDDSGWPGRRE
jgi:hypothetical protein